RFRHIRLRGRVLLAGGRKFLLSSVQGNRRRTQFLLRFDLRGLRLLRYFPRGGNRLSCLVMGRTCLIRLFTGEPSRLSSPLQRG
ncbi:hypothetical protein QP415_12420, partial [Pauljensenia sp. UMB3104]|uniref:hypothetical protein n=1 Tax=Pauljensenia sp. UMB3104 TaxID=3046331 RepID=UPI00254FB16F